MPKHVLFLISLFQHITLGWSTVLTPQGRPFELVLQRHLPSASCTILSLRSTQLHKRALHSPVTQVLPMDDALDATSDRVVVIALTVYDAYSAAREECSVLVRMNDQATPQVPIISALPEAPPLEVRPLVISGNPSNRVDLVFFSDGYTASERAKFFRDAQRLALDMSSNQTFASVKPLMNFHGAFSPSNESGVGVAGKPLDTVFGLFRDGTELRAVYTSKPKVARAACNSLGDACDYPILLGNDDLYGGLGGSFSITTASRLNGALVLRHELGHSIIPVGEEYDGGYAYFGVNAAQNLSSTPSHPFKWAHWLSSSEHVHNGHTHTLEPLKPRHERAIMSTQAYTWTLLNHSSPFSIKFTSPGTYPRHMIWFSLSGFPKKSHLTVTLDGKDIGWEPNPVVEWDRWHYDIPRDGTLEGGEHVVSFMLGEEGQEGKAQVCSVEVLEFGNEEEFNSSPNAISAYPTFSLSNQTTYRPTNENCLMRLVTQTNFCSPCLEGLWLALISRVDIIEDLELTPSPSSSNALAVLHLVEFPDDSLASHNIKWTKDGVEVEGVRGRKKVEVSEGNWMVDVELKTPEVRKDEEGLMKGKRIFLVG